MKTKTMSEAAVEAVAIRYHHETGNWPKVRQLRDACHVSNATATHALKGAKDRLRPIDNPADSRPFCALARALGMSPQQAVNKIDDLKRRNITSTRGNTHLSRLDLIMLVGLQQPDLDTADMTKRELIEHIIDPASLRFTEMLRQKCAEQKREEDRRPYEQEMTEALGALLENSTEAHENGKDPASE